MISAPVSRASRGPSWLRTSGTEILCLALVLAIFGSNAVFHAWNFPLWFDEFFTLCISRLPSIRGMLAAMPADGQPPMQYLITAVALMLPGKLELLLRLPDLLAYIIAGLLTYKIVRMRRGSLAALFATCMLMGSALVAFSAYDARPYMLLCCFTAITFKAWQESSNGEQGRRGWLFFLAIGVAGTILTHHFGIIHVMLFLGIGEAARAVSRRKPDWPLWLAILIGCSPIFFTAHLAAESHRLLGEPIRQSARFWAKPSWPDLYSYGEMFPRLLIYCAGAFFLLFWRPWKMRQPENYPAHVPIHEWVGALVLSLQLPFILLLSHFETGYFISRYAIGTALGLAILSGYALGASQVSRHFAERQLRLTLICYLVLLFSWDSLVQRAQTIRPAPVLPDVLTAAETSRLPIVIANAENFTQFWWYATPALRQRFVYLFDNEYAKQQRGFVGELSLTADSSVMPFPMREYHQFISDNGTFLLLVSGRSQYVWLPDRLAGAGWRMRQIAVKNTDELFQVDSPDRSANQPIHR